MNDKKIITAFIGTVIFTLLASGIFLLMAGSSDENIRLQLRLTAQLSLLILIFVMVARPLWQLSKSAFTKKLLAMRPILGVILAGTFTSHMALLIYRSTIIDDFQLILSDNILGTLTFIFIYAMLITTFSGPRRAIGQQFWKALHKFGIYFILFGFMLTLLPSSIDKLSEINWGIFSIFAALLLLRIAAFIKSR
ncbi:MAG: hypothetical protein GY781_02520 [Gammaproteobacteria bacterium]|nr:hypothetical protein [Gammaproteobacteria bacterium]